MKIAAIGNFWYPEQGGGLDRYFHGLVQQLAADGDDVDFFAAGSPPAQFHGARGFSLTPSETNIHRRAFSATNVLRNRLQRDYDVVNVHFTLYGLAALPYIPVTTPVVFHFHGPWDLESIAEGQSALGARVKHFLESLMFRRSSHFITVSRAFADLLCRHYHIDPERVSVVPLGIDTGFFQERDRREARARLGWPQDRFVLFTARRLVQRVGVRELIEALRMTSSRVWCAIAGSGPLRSELQQQIAESDLAERVHLLGYVSEETLADAYAAADLVVLPSQELEGFGSIIAEALASGTPVLVTPVGGMPEFIRPLDPKLVACDRAPQALARAIDRWVAAPGKLPEAAACRAYAVATFDWKPVAARVRTVFSHAQTVRRPSTGA